ncbi:MAG: 16S rRNA (guanine(527)-N(7))-methyltransferase RsmG [Gammaproteobacteria bacterium]
MTEPAATASNNEDLSVLLARGLEQMNLPLPPQTQAKLIGYLALLSKWNRVYNLTAVRDPVQMVMRHLLDSLSVAPYIKGPRVLDVGTGAGLPGIPLALALPDVHFVLLDSNRKKTRFVTQAVADLGMSNVTVEACRIESYRPDEPFDTVISRAFSELVDMLTATDRLCRAGGVMLAMKGEYPAQEMAVVPECYAAADVHPLIVPGLDAKRHVVCVAARGAN